jgi:predicted RND superfamily exporter protein
VNGLAERSARWVWRHRFRLAAAILFVTVFAARELTTLGVSNSLQDWYPEGDAELTRYRDFQARYGSDEIIVVAISADRPFDDEQGREVVGKLTDDLLDVPGVATVTSTVTVPGSLAEARGRLLSGDGQTTALVVQMLAGEEIEARRHTILQDIRRVTRAAGFEARLGGYGVVFDALNEASTTGAANLIVYAHIVMIVLLVILFRRVLPVLLTLASVGAATVWTMGLYAATGHQLNMVTMVLPTLVLVIGIADCLHILRCVAAQDRRQDQAARVIRGLAGVIGPCFLMSITTAAGFLGLTASGLPVVQQLGWFGATGVLAAFVTSTVVVTAGLGWRGFEPGRQSSRLDTAAVRLHETALRQPLLIIAGFAVLAGLFGYGVTQLDSDTDSIGYMKKSHVVRLDSDFIEAEIGAYVPIEFTVTADSPIVTAANLDAIWQWQRRVEGFEAIGWSWSLVTALDIDSIPSSAGSDTLLNRLDRIRRFSPAALNAMMSGDGQLRVSFGAPIMSARSVRDLIDRILAQAALPPSLSVEPAGYSPLYTRIVDEIVSSQLRGFGAAIVLIVGLIGLAMKSWRRMLLALPANALPVLFTLGLMGLTGIPLDVASATIASVILGLVVDDTVHLLRRYPGEGIRGSLRTAASKAGGTLIMTTMVLTCGFLVLGLADIRSIAWFGMLTSFAVMTAIFADLLLLPALARAFAGRL